MNIQFKWLSHNCYVGATRFGSISDYGNFWRAAINLPGMQTASDNNRFMTEAEAKAAFERRVVAWFEQIEPFINLRTPKRSD